MKVLLSAHVKRFNVSGMQDFFFKSGFYKDLKHFPLLSEMLKVNPKNILQTWAKPGVALQALLSLIWLLSQSVTLFLPQLYGAAKTKRLGFAPAGLFISDLCFIISL